MLALLAAAVAGTRGVQVVPTAPPGLRAAFAPRRVALVVGIDAYEDPALGDLRYAAKDAADLSDVLTDPAHGAFDEVSALTGTVTREAFWTAARAVTAHLQREDTFVLYVAAHGTLDLSGETALYVMPSDGDLDDVRGTGIAVADLERLVDGVASRRRVLALDTCYSGVGRSALSTADQAKMATFRGPVPPPVASAVSQAEARLYSAHLNQAAIEDDVLQNGVYTHFLIEALEGSGDLDGDGLVEVTEAHGWARDRTLEYTGGTQVPWMQQEVVGRDGVYLAGDPDERRAAERAILVGLDQLPAHAVVTVDGAARGGGAVEPGPRRVRVEVDGDARVDRRVQVAAGRSLDVGAWLEARAARWLVEGGATWNPANPWIASAGPLLGAWWLPADIGGGRPAFGLETTLGVGAVPAGQVLGRAGWWWGDRLSVGPTLAGGLLWRIQPELGNERQGAPVAATGLQVRWMDAPFQAGLAGSLLVFPTEEGPELLPRIALTAGAAL